MADVKQDDAASADRGAAEDFAAPERGSAEELLDAGRATRSTRCATRPPTSWPRPCSTSSPAPSSASGRPSHGRLLLRLPADAAAQARRPRGDRGADGGERRRRPAVRAPGAPAGGGEGLLRRARPAVQGRDPRRPRGEGQGRRRADAAGLGLRARPLRRPLQGAPCREHRQARAVQAPGRRRRVLAGRREAPDAPAHLRHGLADPGGARSVPVAAGRGEEARPPPARRPARPLQLPRRSARAPPSGTPRAR